MAKYKAHEISCGSKAEAIMRLGDAAGVATMVVISEEVDAADEAGENNA